MGQTTWTVWEMLTTQQVLKYDVKVIVWEFVQMRPATLTRF